MKGKLGRYLGLDEHLALGVNIAWYPGFTHHVTWAALWDFMTGVPGSAARSLGRFVASRKDGPIRSPRRRPTAKATPKQRELEERYLVGDSASEIRRRMMARDGYRIFDSDTHVGPDAAILSTYLSAAEKERLAGWAAIQVARSATASTYTKGQRALSPPPRRRRTR